MNPFIIPEVLETTKQVATIHYPLPRAAFLQTTLAQVFSRHLGHLQSGHNFEAEWILVTGSSGSGKTTEVEKLVSNFNAAAAALPSGQTAKIVPCMLDGVTGWKGIGRRALHALGYPLVPNSRITQAEIWEKVRLQAKAQGVIGIYFDEAQHALRGKSDAERAAVLDSFKTLLKNKDWPLMLILSGVHELENYIKDYDQLLGKRSKVEFLDIDLPRDFAAVHELVGRFAVHFGLPVASEIPTEEFYDRLSLAAAYRWGLLINILVSAITVAKTDQASALELNHFVQAWIRRTQQAPSLTPFTHEHYQSVFSPDRPFWPREAEIAG